MAAWALLSTVALYSIFIGDYSQLSLRLICALLFAAATVYFSFGCKERIRFSVPFICPLAMAFYGAGQTLWSEQRIAFNGLDKTQFWLALAVIGFTATQVFQWAAVGEKARQAMALFGGFEALLSVLEQASHTGKYFWLVPSGFPDIYGTFPYYNNFAQLIELTLPITLWEALRRRQTNLFYLLISALQVGAVVASASRAGAVLVFTELLVVLLLVWLQRRKTMSLAVLALTLGLSGVFTYVAGYEQVVHKLQRSDQLSNRRVINRSSLEMIRERPLTGWGLGAYAPVYKMFALYDDGTWVNQAHNDYLEWAAEGGILYASIMLGLVLWSIRPALRSIWGIGVLGFYLHALVDYPFARLGTSAWFYVLCGMLAARGGIEMRSSRKRSRSQRVECEEAAPALVSEPAA